MQYAKAAFAFLKKFARKRDCSDREEDRGGRSGGKTWKERVTGWVVDKFKGRGGEDSSERKPSWKERIFGWVGDKFKHKKEDAPDTSRERKVTWKEQAIKWVGDKFKPQKPDSRDENRGPEDQKEDPGGETEDPRGETEDPEDQKEVKGASPERKITWKERIAKWVGDKFKSRNEESPNDENVSLKERITGWLRKKFKGKGNDDSDKPDYESDIELDAAAVDEDHIDIESGRKDTVPKIEYESTWKSRLLVGFFAQRALAESRVVRIPYRKWCKYLMIVLLVLVGVFMTPQLVPNWVGYRFATTKDLCIRREDKLVGVRGVVENLTKLHQGRNYVKDMEDMVTCFNRAAAEFYIRPERFQWPEECTEEKAERTFTREVCNPQRDYVKKRCVGGATGFFGKAFGGKTCVDVKVERKCVTVTEGGSQQALLDLYREQALSEKAQKANETAREIGAVAANKAEEVMENLRWKVDIASNLFIAYTVVALIVAAPIRIHKSEKKSRILSAMFSLSKYHWILLVLIVWTAVEGLQRAFVEIDWKLYITNFSEDPCYVDANFTSQRTQIITDVCADVSDTYVKADQHLQDLDSIYFKTRLFALCKADISDDPRHPAEDDMKRVLDMLKSDEYRNPAQCDLGFLNEATERAPSSTISPFRVIISTGIIPKLLLKFVLTSLIVNVISFFEPMVTYAGQIELWDREKLDPDEEESVRLFARDKRLIPLIITIFVTLTVLVLALWGIFDTKGEDIQRSELDPHMGSGANLEPNRRQFECPKELFPPYQ